MFERLKTYLQETRIELKKVTWPSRQQTTRFTWAVILVSAAVGAFLGGLDFLFQWVLNTFVL